MRKRSSRIAGWALVLLASARLHAHDFWIEPSTFRPVRGSHVAISFLVGEHLQGERISPRAEGIERFVALQADQETPIIGELDVTGEGLLRIVYRGRPRPITIGAAKFEQYLREEGLERIIALRASRGESTRDGREIYSRCAKSLLQPQGQAPAGEDRATGLPLEIIAERNPYREVGQNLSLLIRYRGEPLVGVLVSALNQSLREPMRARTDDHGRVTFPIEAPGLWLVKTVHMVEAPEGTDAEWESLWASLTFGSSNENK